LVPDALLGPASTMITAWLCTRCMTTNAADTDRCGRRTCQLSRKVVGVNVSNNGCSRSGTERAFDSAEYNVVEKRKRCGICPGCVAFNCGRCAMCLDMPKYGGKGTKRQTCERRVCDVIFAEWAERETERMAQLEEIRQQRTQQREAERQARAARLETVRAEREAERQQKLEVRQASRIAKEVAKAHRLALRAVSGGVRHGGRGRSRNIARILDYPDELTAYGWGVTTESVLRPGTPVEVLGLDDGIRGACFAAQVARPTEPELRMKPSAADADESPAVVLAATHAAAAAAADAAATAAAALASANPSDAAAAAAAASAASAAHVAKAKSAALGTFAAAASAALGFVLVEYLDLVETDGVESPLLREWVACGNLRPAPPACPIGFAGLLRTGDRVQLLFDEAYWDVTVDDVLGTEPNALEAPRPFIVSSLLYAATHVVGAEQLRPLWQLDGGEEGPVHRPAWRYELLAGRGFVGLAAAAPALAAAKSAASAAAVADSTAIEGAAAFTATPISPKAAVFLFAEGEQRRHSSHFHATLRAMSRRCSQVE